MAAGKSAKDTDTAKGDAANGAEHASIDDVKDILSGFGEDPLSFTDDEVPADDGPSPIVDAIIAERDDLKDKLLRALAETENLRKRAERDRRDAEVYGGTKLARDLLSVYDNMVRAMDAIDDELREKAAGLIEGLELTQKELVSAFGKHRIEKIEPEFGEKFDPNLHQAMFEAPVPNAAQGTIIQVMNAGFTIGERLLRPAQVGVSSTPASQVNTPEPTEDAG